MEIETARIISIKILLVIFQRKVINETTELNHPIERVLASI